MRWTALIAVAVLSGIIAAGCATAETDPTAVFTPPATIDEVQLEPLVTEEPATPVMDQLVAMLPEVTPEVDQNCIDCHSDAELLQEVAEEEEVVEKLSEGSG